MAEVSDELFPASRFSQSMTKLISAGTLLRCAKLAPRSLVELLYFDGLQSSGLNRLIINPGRDLYPPCP
jgi:hypothetical protein